MSTTAEPLLISLKPNYADLVFKGLKTAELRRRISAHVESREVFVYVSSPVMEIRGGFRVGQVWSGSPEQIWSSVADLAGVSRAEFNDYYAGTNVAFALEITNVWEYARPICLKSLRTRFPDFVVPQSFRFVRKSERRLFKRLKRRTIVAA